MNWHIKPATAVLAIFLLAGAAQAANLGGFTFARGGGGSIGHYFDSVVTDAYEAAHPNFVLHETDTLTPAFLDNVDVLLIASVFDGSPVIPLSPLTAAEEAALLDFINNGGGVIILADNAGVSSGNASLLSPFGMAAGGALSGTQTVIPVNTPHPVTDGISSFEYAVPGYLTQLGPTTCRAELPNAPAGTCALAIADHGQLSPGAGALIVLSDYNVHHFSGDQRLFQQMLEFAEPQPALDYVDSVSLTVDGIEAVAALAFDPSTERSVVTIKAATGGFIRRISYFSANAGWRPHAIVSVPDVDGSGAPELGVLATSGDGVTKMKLKDASTKNVVATIQFPD